MISAPDYIQLYVTTRCNHACGFCFNKKLPSYDDMTFGDFKRLVASLKGIGTRTLDILGGEPTLHEDLVRFVRYALQEGMKLTISSNGTGTALLAEIRNRYPEVVVGISVCDRKTVPALEDLIRRTRMLVKTVVGKKLDARLIEELLACDPGRLYLLYRDALDPGELAGTAPFDDFLGTVQERYDPALVGTVSCSGFLPDFHRFPVLLKARCPAGTTKLGILPDGSVYPCNLFFRFREFRLGNIFTTAFEEIWHHPQLSFFRTFAGNRCPRRDCELHAKCHGGCPAHSYAHRGRRSAPEPRCVPDEHPATGPVSALFHR